jgi:hypothetical protein
MGSELSEKEQIDRLKKLALQPVGSYGSSTEYDACFSAVETLAAFGEPAIPALIEVSEKANTNQIKERALSWLAKLKSSD